MFGFGCSSSSPAPQTAEPGIFSDASAGQSSSADQGEDPEASGLSFFPEALVSDLDALQSAIDVRLDEDRIQCLREAGWDVPARSADSIEANTQLASDPLTVLLSDLRNGAGEQRDGFSSASPNQEFEQNLSEDERGQFFDQSNRCVIDSEWNRGHPLGEEGTLYSEAYAAASDRVTANNRFRDSLADADRCFEESGFGSRSEAREALSGAVIDVLVQVEDKDIDRSEALLSAEQLEARQQQLDALDLQCYEPHNRLTATIFAQELSDEVSRSPGLQAEILRLEDFVDDYRDVLDAIDDGE